ncbi:MAG: phenazine antibiotic biosynthesis protein, partial [Solirubrobacterales bacterium]|nr:phenazine antibiotic biosynthesis protein [Solirubrobacterales bacterium]
MLQYAKPVLDVPFDVDLDPDEFVRAAMDWHFSPTTGSPFWLQRAKSLEFDPRTDVKSFEDLTLFPNVTNDLRDVRAEDLIPQGYGPHPEVVGVYESGGTTGAPKRIVVLREWWDRLLAWQVAHLDAGGVPRDRNWLLLIPSGPHMAGELTRRQATALGGLSFTIDMDPRWVKKLIAAGRADEADAYAEHVIDQAAFALQTQDIGVLMSTPPLLERLARRDDLVELIRQKVQMIEWAGAHMDADTRHLYRTEVFPGLTLNGTYGSTMVLGGATERLDLADEDPCIFDPFSPYVSFSVVEADTGRKVPYGERGQVVMNHVSWSFLLPNNLERDMATRVAPPEGQAGDSVADVTPVKRFDDEAVIEGVY